MEGDRSGRYRLEATAKNRVTGRESRSALDLEAFDHQPGVSDLLLSPGIRLASAGDSVPQAGELRRGGALVTVAAVPRLGPLRSTAHYLLEVYAAGEREDTGTMSVRVRSGGSTLRGHVSLAGLPPGRYTLVVSVELAGRTEERRAEFVMGEEAVNSDSKQ